MLHNEHPRGFISQQSFELNNEEKLVSEVLYLGDLLTQVLYTP